MRTYCKNAYKNRAYEINKGKTKELFDYWMEKCKKLVNKSSIKEFKQSIFDIVSDFEKLKLIHLL